MQWDGTRGWDGTMQVSTRLGEILPSETDERGYNRAEWSRQENMGQGRMVLEREIMNTTIVQYEIYGV